MKTHLELAVDLTVAMINAKAIKLPKSRKAATKQVGATVSEIYRQLAPIPTEPKNQ